MKYDTFIDMIEDTNAAEAITDFDVAAAEHAKRVSVRRLRAAEAKAKTESILTTKPKPDMKHIYEVLSDCYVKQPSSDIEHLIVYVKQFI